MRLNVVRRVRRPGCLLFWRSHATATATTNTSTTTTTRQTAYILPMFPYPSGSLHMGHVRVYTISDVLARFHRLAGRKVIHPIGWDAFGLPAENAALERNLDPADWTNSNILEMRRQLQSIGADFDWHREIRTNDPAYYKWTQLLFLRLMRAGLVERREAFVNWDPVDKTVLANEQITQDGRAERSGAKVELLRLSQWFIKTTHYAKELLDDLKHLDWPESVKQQQANWIVSLDVKPLPFLADSSIVAGVFTGFWAHNPALGDARLPVFVTSDMIHDPHGHAEHDADIEPNDTQLLHRHAGEFGQVGNDQPSVLQLKVAEWQACGLVRPHDKYKLRDWLVSRQRSWGTPIPIVYCESCGIVPLPEEQLPMLHLPWKAPKSTVHDAECACPKCSRPARRETDTMDTFVDSSWYWLRYLDPANTSELASRDSTQALPVDIYVGGVEHAIMHLLYARFMGKFLTDEGIVSLPHGEPFKRLLAQGMVVGKTYKCPDTGQYLKRDDLDLTDPSVPLVKATGKTPAVTVEKMSKSKHNGVNPMTVLEKHGADAVRLYILYRAAPADLLAWDESALIGMERFLTRVRSLASSATPPPSSDSQTPAQLDQSIAKAMHEAVHEVTTAMTTTFAFHVGIASLIKLSHVLAEAPDRRSESFRKGVQLLVRLLHPYAPLTSRELWSTLSTAQPAWPTPAEVEFSESTQICVVQLNGRKALVLDDVPSSISTDHDAIKRHVLASQPVKDLLINASTGDARLVRQVFVAKTGRLVNLVI
ncbi:hypothetical protein BC831DRAFT_448063 [Entophlyctis helioformis]|nr:hypothetical protein BC831DRAFT_448063 [Entophlyctis helioformis]